MTSPDSRPCLACLVAVALTGLLWAQPLLAQTGGKWGPSGAPRTGYEMGGDPTVKHGSEGGGYVRSITDAPKDFGNLMTKMPPGPYEGKRTRLSVWVRTESVAKEVVLWFSVIGPYGVQLGLDNMEKRPIKGTTEWKKYDLVADIPPGSVEIGYGIILDGAGKVWLDGATLEAVGPDVPVTTVPAWGPTGTNPEDYEMGGDPMKPHGAPEGGYIRSKAAEPRTFGALASAGMADLLVGKRVRFSGYLRTENVEKWAGIWLRVDGPKGEQLNFDNMSGRPIKGTTDWKKYDVVLDVPSTAAALVYGIILEGKGQAWFDGVTLEPVGADVPATQTPNPYPAYYAASHAEAAKLLLERLARTPTSYTLRLFYYLSLHRNGQVKEARDYIANFAKNITEPQWGDAVVKFYAGLASEQDVLTAAADPDAAKDKRRKCQAYYYLGMAYLLGVGKVTPEGSANTVKAAEYLERSVTSGETSASELTAAKAEVTRIKK